MKLPKAFALFHQLWGLGSMHTGVESLETDPVITMKSYTEGKLYM